MDSVDKKTWLLSKTSYIKGKQCIKALYLHTNRIKTGTSTTQQTKHQNKGKTFENMVRETLFPDAINLNKKLQNNYTKYLEDTKQILDSNAECSIFEAALLHNKIFILIDILQKNIDGSFDLFEIKNKKKINHSIIRDASFQYHVSSLIFGDYLNSINVILQNGSGNFKCINVTEQAKKNQKQITKDIEYFTKDIINNPEPIIKTGKHCFYPYLCKYRKHCNL